MASSEQANIEAGRSDKKPSLSPFSDSVSETHKTIKETEKNHGSKPDLFKRWEKWLISETSVAEFSLIFSRKIRKKNTFLPSNLELTVGQLQMWTMDILN